MSGYDKKGRIACTTVFVLMTNKCCRTQWGMLLVLMLGGLYVLASLNRNWRRGSQYLDGNILEGQPRRISILIMTTRYERIYPMIHHYTRMTAVSDILIVWNNVHKPPPALINYDFPVPVRVVIEAKNTLNNRYRHPDLLKSKFVVLTDDDLLLDWKTVHYSLNFLHQNPSTLVGFFPRYISQSRGKWVYEPARSWSRWLFDPSTFMLTTGQAHALHVDWMLRFLQLSPEILQFIDNNKPTCEDITLHFLVANATGPENVACLVPCSPRNIGHEHGMSQGSRSHVEKWLAKRSQCIDRLDRQFGRMPLLGSRRMHVVPC